MIQSINVNDNYAPSINRELVQAKKSGIDLLPYIEDGYDADQLNGIRYALELGVDINPYLNLEYRGACIREIAKGIKKGINVEAYRDLKYTWRKMREIRLGLEQKLDINKYNDALYSCWQMCEIRLGLKANLDVSYYSSFMYTAKEMRKRRLMLENKKNAPNLSGDWKITGDKDYDLCISPDGVKAYFNWHGRITDINLETLNNILDENGIIYGIIPNALQTIVKKCADVGLGEQSDFSILVAKGKTPRDGKDGYYEWMFNVQRKFWSGLNEDKTIEFDKIQWFYPVKQGQILAVYHFAEPAVDGISVYGKSITAKIGREKPPLCGEGFEILSDFCTYVSCVDGQVMLKNKKMYVSKLLELEGLNNMDSYLDYDGDVHIKGNVEGPVSIEVTGDLVIDGFIKDADINCGGNLILKCGINNSESDNEVRVKGAVVCRFIEYTTVNACGNIYIGTSLNSNLSTYGEIVSYGNKGGIMGGSSYSEKGICITNLGNDVGIPTVLSMGSNMDIIDQLKETEKEMKGLKSDIDNLSEAISQISDNKNPVNISNEELQKKLEDTIADKRKQLLVILNRMTEIKRRDNRARRSKIIVEQQVYENVKIRYLNHIIDATPSTHVSIEITKDGLLMEKGIRF